MEEKKKEKKKRKKERSISSREVWYLLNSLFLIEKSDFLKCISTGEEWYLLNSLFLIEKSDICFSSIGVIYILCVVYF